LTARERTRTTPRWCLETETSRLILRQTDSQCPVDVGRVLEKSVLKDTAKSLFKGMIRIEKGAGAFGLVPCGAFYTA